VSGFSSAWLALRERYDLAARNDDVLAAVMSHVADRPAIGVVDLACGTGSTLRAIASRLRPRQDWRLVDNNLSLLARAAGLDAGSGIKIAAVPVDLALDLEAALDGPIDLVTTSALLDLVSDEWLSRLVVETAARRLPVYAALTYDGDVALDPVDPLDAAVVAAVNRHQLGDKGFGPALGPAAAAAAIACFERARCTVTSGKSDWVFAAQDRDIQSLVIAGWAAAAAEIGDLSPRAVADWSARRGALVTAGRSTMRVGHVDLFARPTGTR
jgi:SAM-dependent methyltransferase